MKMDSMKMRNKRGLLFIFLFFLFSINNAAAHEIEGHEEVEDNKTFYPFKTLNVALFGLISLGVFVFIVLFHKNKLKEKNKKLLYGLLLIIISGVTIYFIFTTVHVNFTSVTKGPVHWHADFEVWDCGKQVDLVKPGGLSSRVGTELFHEHGDDRIHVEGPILDKRNVDLHGFFKVISGNLADGSFTFPTDTGIVERKNGDLCKGNIGKVQVFLYRVVNPRAKKSEFLYEQIKLENFKDYVLSPYSDVPPGDCIIIEFAEDKDKTDKICATYESEIQEGNMREKEKN